MDYLRNEQDIDLREFGVKFDVYYLESSLYAEGKVDEVVKALIASGKTYEKDGALWLRSTEYGDDKDRVIRKSDGTYTYFVPDVAYHLTSGGAACQGDQRAGHRPHGDQGARARRPAGAQRGVPPGYPDYVMHSMVRVMRGGEEVKISKRAGSYVTLRDLLDWVGRDAVRFFLLSRRADADFVFDIDLPARRPRRTRSTTCNTRTPASAACSANGKETRRLERGRPLALTNEKESRSRSASASFPIWLPKPRASFRRTRSPFTCAASRPSFTATIMPSASSSTTRRCARRGSRSARRCARRWPAGCRSLASAPRRRCKCGCRDR